MSIAGQNQCIDGQRLSCLEQKKAALVRRNAIGFVFQSFNLIPVLTAYENIEYVLLLQGIFGSARRKRVLEALDKVKMTDRRNHLPGQLSAGQQQRVAVARAIVGNPCVVVADEPTGCLDSATGAELVRLLRDINTEKGTTFVFSSHDPHVIQSATRILYLQYGAVVSDQGNQCLC